MSDFVKLHQNNFDLKKFIASALKEDVGDGDHTSLSTIPKDHKGKMRLLVKEDGIIAGIDAAEMIFKQVDKKIKFKKFISDGARVYKNEIAFTVEGNTRDLLTTERLVLNIMQRMSGIATKTNYLQRLCRDTEAKVIDTRKTTPGFRFFEKWAVVIGGGANHRYGLFDMILIKDNHIDFCGGIIEAIYSANLYLKKTKKKLAIEVEARTIEDVKKVLQNGNVQRILLDNFTPEQTLEAVKLTAAIEAAMLAVEYSKALQTTLSALPKQKVVKTKLPIVKAGKKLSAKAKKEMALAKAKADAALDAEATALAAAEAKAKAIAEAKVKTNRLEVESSGGITEKNISAYAKCGVDFISVGALTHHVKSLDLSLKMVK